MSSYKGPFILTDPEGYDVSLTMFSSASTKISYIDKNWVQHDETISNTDGFDKKTETVLHNVLYIVSLAAATSSYDIAYNFQPITSKKRLTKNYKDYAAFSQKREVSTGYWGSWNDSDHTYHTSDYGCSSEKVGDWSDWEISDDGTTRTRTRDVTYWVKVSSSSKYCLSTGGTDKEVQTRKYFNTITTVVTNDSGGSSKPSDATTD